MDTIQRVKNAIAYQPIDYVPAGLFGTAQAYLQGLTEYVGCNSIEAMFEKLHIDIWHTDALTYSQREYPYMGQSVNPFRDLYDEHNPNPPFAQAEEIEQVLSYPFPSMDEFDCDDYAEQIDRHKDFAVCSGVNAAIFHNYSYMCGQQNALCLLKTQPEIAHAIIGHITDFWIAYINRVLEIGDGKAVMMENCNDFGTQISLFIGPDDFRTFFKPQLKRLYDAIHAKGLTVVQHSCGAITPIIGDFAEIGADVLNPIQVSAKGMRMEEVAPQFMGKIAFYGGIDTQYLLPNGTEQAVKAQVRTVIDLFGKGGGYLLSGSQGLLQDIPYANAVAMLDINNRKV